jgi:hypothetical protein
MYILQNPAFFGFLQNVYGRILHNNAEFRRMQNPSWNKRAKQVAASNSFSDLSIPGSLFILAEGAIALSVTLSGGALFAS